MACTVESYDTSFGRRVRIRDGCSDKIIGSGYDTVPKARDKMSGMDACQQPCPSAPAPCIPPTFDQWGTETSPGTCGGVPAAPAPPIRARPTLEEIRCTADQYAGWDGDPNHPAVCIPYDVVGVPAIPDIPTPPLAPAPGTTSKCPRGSAYDKPWFGFGGCDPGYVSSSGALVQGMGAQCICAETPEGRQVTQTPAEGEYQPDDLGLGGLMKMLPQLIMVLVVVQIIGAFRK